MCGIVGAIAERNVVPILLEGLRRLEYRGYDSAGIATLDDERRLQRVRAVGKVQALTDSLAIFFPEQRQRHAFLLQFLMNQCVVGLGKGRLAGSDLLVEQFLQPGIIEVFGNGPG